MGLEATSNPALLAELSERPLTAVAVELEALRVENTRLREKVTRLEQELGETRSVSMATSVYGSIG